MGTRGAAIWGFASLLMLGCGDSSSSARADGGDAAGEPDVHAPQAVALAIEAPTSAVENVLFEIGVRAMTPTGEAALGFSETIQLSASRGELSASSIAMEDGFGTVEVSLNREGGTVLTAAGESLTDTADLVVEAHPWVRTPDDWVLDGESDHWTFGGFLSPSIIVDGETLWLYASTDEAPIGGGLTGGLKVVRARSEDEGVTWVLDPDAPVWTPVAAGVDSIGPLTVHLSDDGMLELWYTARIGDVPSSIAHATSTDGVTWSASSCSLLSEDSVAAWMQGGVSNPTVIELDSTTLRIYFTAQGLDGIQAIGAVEGNCTDGWSSPSLVLARDPSTWDAAGVATPGVWREGSVWKMLYSGRASDSSKPHIGYATGLDGLVWEKSASNPVIEQLTDFPSWDVHGVDGPCVIPLSSGVLSVFFNGHPVSQRPRVVRAVAQSGDSAIH